jgi:glycosyltransferase involved in cell wall biosynthesis
VITNEVNRARFLKSCYGLPQIFVVPTLLPRAWPIPSQRDTHRRRLVARLTPERAGSVHLICVGGPVSAKRCSPALLEAMQSLGEEYVLYFSNATSDATRAAVESTGLIHRSIILAKLPYDEMLAYMGACDVGILLYPDDGIHHFYQSPGRLSEYVRCGLPLVASAFPSLELLLLKHDLGRVCDPTSPAAIAAAMREICEVDQETAERRRQRLRTIAERELVYDRHAGVIEDVIARAARSSRPHSG